MIHRFVFLFALMLPCVAHAKFDGQQFRDWGGNCEANGQVCYLEQTLTQGEQPVMSSILGYAPGQNHPALIFEVSALYVPAGLWFQPDNGGRIPLKGTCNQGKCRAFAYLTPQQLNQLKRGRRGTVHFNAKANEAQLQYPVSLMGITAGLNALGKIR